MPQGVFPYKYEKEKSVSGMTSLAGLPVYLDLDSVLITSHPHVKVQGWTDEQIVLSLPLSFSTSPEESVSIISASLRPMRGSAGCFIASNLRVSREKAGGRWRGGGEKRKPVSPFPLKPPCLSCSRWNDRGSR